jgi:predicted outer membrane protein
MSASPIMRVGVVAAGLSCLLIGNAWAQQETERQSQREGRSSQSLDNDRIGVGQIDQSTRPGQQHTAQRPGTQANAGQEQQVQHFLAACLLAKNKAEVDMGKFAQQQAQNPQVKEFAQRMVQDHQRLVQQLQPMAGKQGAQGAQGTTSSDTQSQFDAQRQASDTTRLPGSPGAGQASDQARSQSSTRTAGQSALGQSATGSGQHDAAIQKLAQIDRQITEQCTQALREELEQKQGAEFDKAYVGSQIAGHMQMLAALKVIEQQGPQQLQQLAQQAQPVVQEHLEHAKQLKKQLDGGSPSSQAERPSDRTQR